MNADDSDNIAPEASFMGLAGHGDVSRVGCLRKAFEEWAESVRPRLVGLAGRLLSNRHDAEEIAQDALALAWRENQNLKDLRKRNTWIYRTTINLSFNRLRRKRAGELPSAGSLPGQPDNVARQLKADELARRLRIAVSQLPERQQAALVLRELEGLAYEQIAAILETSSRASRLLVHRAREAVRKILLQRWPDSFEMDE